MCGLRRWVNPLPLKLVTQLVCARNPRTAIVSIARRRCLNDRLRSPGTESRGAEFGHERSFAALRTTSLDRRLRPDNGRLDARSHGRLISPCCRWNDDTSTAELGLEFDEVEQTLRAAASSASSKHNIWPPSCCGVRSQLRCQRLLNHDNTRSVLCVGARLHAWAQVREWSAERRIRVRQHQQPFGVGARQRAFARPDRLRDAGPKPRVQRLRFGEHVADLRRGRVVQDRAGQHRDRIHERPLPGYPAHRFHSKHVQRGLQQLRYQWALLHHASAADRCVVRLYESTLCKV
jgi:hypothetical protein